MANSPLKKAPGEGTGPTTHADSRGIIVGRVPSRGEEEVFKRAANRPGRPDQPTFMKKLEIKPVRLSSTCSHVQTRSHPALSDDPGFSLRPDERPRRTFPEKPSARRGGRFSSPGQTVAGQILFWLPR